MSTSDELRRSEFNACSLKPFCLSEIEQLKVELASANALIAKIYTDYKDWLTLRDELKKLEGK